MDDQSHYLYQILDLMLEGCQIIDFDWYYRYLNNSVVQHARLDRNKLIGHQMMEVYPGIETTPMFDMLRKCMDERVSQKFTNNFQYEDGNSAWFELNAIPIEEGILILSWDITEQKMALDTMAENAETLQLVIDTTPIAIIMTDYPGNVSIWNRASESMFGWDSEEILHQPNPIFSNAKRDEILQVRKQILAGGAVYNYETEFVRKDGTQIASIFSATALRDTTGKVNGVLAIVADVTERKRAEEEIRKLNTELEQRVQERTAELSDLYNNAPCGYHSLDLEGKFIFVNDTELKWLGYRREELIGNMKVTDLFTPESIKRFHENYPQFMKNGYINDLEFDMIRKDGTIFPILLSGTAIYDEKGNYVMSRSTMIDHTARKKAELAMLEAQRKLETANKELEAFSYSVSHDLRAPLRHISGFVELLKGNTGSSFDEKGQHYLDIIEDSAGRMGMLIDDLLTFSRIGRAEFKKSQVKNNLLVQETIQELQAETANRQIEWKVGSLPEACGDLSLLRLVWINLISNAIKYTGPVPQTRIEIGAKPAEKETIFFIRDNGVGFDMKYADKLFGVFQRLHPANQFEGTGIGLATVQRIILRHGGRIWAESAVNQGATFYFSLPDCEKGENDA